MRLLKAGIDTTVIALWLGHEQVETTQVYVHADLAIKEGVRPNRRRGWQARPLPAARSSAPFLQAL
jgi:integrase